MTQKITDIDAYIAFSPKNIQKTLQQLRLLIKSLDPNITEAMRYGIPTFVLNGNLVHFAAFKKHIGFYPAPLAILRFKKELEPYKTSKGAIQFPLDKPLPLDLITKIVKFRINENLKK